MLNMLQTHCRNCLILPLPAFPPTVPVCVKMPSGRRLRVQGVGGREGGCEWHLGNARWPLQHVSFHASFIHFITSLGRCEGVEKKPCYTETEWEGPHSISSSPGAAIASAGSPLAWLKSAAGNSGRVEVPCECAAAAADGQRTWPCMGDRWVRGANNGRRHGAFFVLALLDRISGECPLACEFSCKAAALCGVCSAFGAQNVFLLHPN